MQETLDIFATHPTDGLANSAVAPLLARYGPNEFEVPPSDPLYLKFAKQVYENPLILLLLGSSVVSALMGQFDDAACVVIAVGIVLTGKQYPFEASFFLLLGRELTQRSRVCPRTTIGKVA